MEYIVKVTGLAQVEQFLKMDAESEEEAIIEVNKYELWNDGVWKFVQLNDIDSVKKTLYVEKQFIEKEEEVEK